jgi:hypothetical protein
MRFVPPLLLIAASIWNFVTADRATTRIREQWEGRQMPTYLGWPWGRPPSASRIRRVSVITGLLFAMALGLGILFG